MRLEYIVFLKHEQIECPRWTDSAGKPLEILVFADEKEMESAFEQEKDRVNNALLIASTDAAITCGIRLGIAVMGYVNPAFPGQSYRGVAMLAEGMEEIDTDFLEKVHARWHRIPWKILETERCVVRELSLEDLDGLFELYADREMTRFTEGLYPYEEEKEYQRAYIENMYRFFGYGMWLVFLKESGELIGRAGLEHREIGGETELELGYLIGKKYQGNGYALEVCHAIVEYAAANTDFPCINCIVQKDNKISVHIAEKLGFVMAGELENDKKMYRFVRELS